MTVNKWWLNTMHNDENYRHDFDSTIVFSISTLCLCLLSYILASDWELLYVMQRKRKKIEVSKQPFWLAIKVKGNSTPYLVLK